MPLDFHIGQKKKKKKTVLRCRPYAGAILKGGVARTEDRGAGWSNNAAGYGRDRGADREGARQAAGARCEVRRTSACPFHEYAFFAS